MFKYEKKGKNIWKTLYDKEKDKWLSTEPQNCPPGETTYKTYEEAENACIDKLIEMVKKK